MSAPMIRTRTPGIFRRGSRYVFTWRDQDGRLRRRSAATMSEAKARRGVELDKARRGERAADPSKTFLEYARKWIDTYTGRTQRGISADTLDDYRKALGLDPDGNVIGGACAFFGSRKLASIGPSDIRAYATDVAQQGLARNTVRLRLAPLKALLAQANEDEVIVGNPAAGLRNLLPPAREQGEDEHARALDPDEYRTVVEQLPERWRLFFSFLAETGLRIGEARELRWKDVELGDDLASELRPRLHVRRRFYRGKVARPKSGKTRALTLSRSLAEALRNLRAGRMDEELVWTTITGKRIGDSVLMARVLKPAAVDAGLGRWVQKPGQPRRAESWVGFHTFRHTCATRLIVEDAWSLEQVQVYLGHSDPMTTRRYYVHLLPKHLPTPTSVLAPSDRMTRDFARTSSHRQG